MSKLGYREFSARQKPDNCMPYCFMHRKALMPTPARRARSVSWPGWETVCGCPYGLTPPCASTTRTPTSTCRMWISSPTSVRCQVTLTIPDVYTGGHYQPFFTIFGQFTVTGIQFLHLLVFNSSGRLRLTRKCVRRISENFNDGNNLQEC